MDAWVRSELVRLGGRLRALRKERGWTLGDLGRRAGLSEAYISRIEGGERQPSLAALFGLARAYGVALSTLLEPEAEDGRCTVVRVGAEDLRPGNGLLYAPLSGAALCGLHAVRILVPAEREGWETYRHEGEEWLYVLSGRLSLRVAEREFELEPGDAAHFDAGEPHRLAALDGEDAEVIVVAASVPYQGQRMRSYL